MTDPITYGRNALFLGELEEWRQRLGLTRQGLADVLGVTYYTVWRWTKFSPLDKPSDRNAEMITMFIQAAKELLERHPDFPERYISLARTAQYLSMPQEFAFDLYRKGVLPVSDFGFMGLWVTREDLKAIKERGWREVSDL